MTVYGISPYAVGGLASGLDTNGIIEKMIEAQRSLGSVLTSKRDRVNLQKTVLQEFNLQLNRLQNAVLNMRLEGTYMARNVSSSNSDILTAKATGGAANGYHTIKVNQIARAARATSNILSPRLLASPPNTAGITGISGALVAAPTYLKGAAAEHAVNAGTMAADITSSNNILKLTYNGTEVSVTLADATAGSTTMADVAADIQNKVNNELNSVYGTSGVNYVLVKPSTDAGVGSNGFYFISNFKGPQYTISVDSTSSAAAAIGYGVPADVTTVAGSQPVAGTHNLTFTAATAATLTGGVFSGNVTMNATDTMNLTINGVTSDVALTTTAAGGTGGVYDWTDDGQMASLAANLQADINAVFGGDAVSVTWNAAEDRLVITNGLAGASNTITVNPDVSGTPSTSLLLTAGTGAVTTAGKDARVVDYFTPVNGSQIVITVSDTTTAGTASSFEGLLSAINGSARPPGRTGSGGGPLIPGVSLIADAGLMEGTAVINTTSGNELSTSAATYSTYTGGSDVGTGTINTAATLKDAGFASAASTATNGTFTINGKTITISDYAYVTVDQVLAMINGSGAGVTASYDSVNDRFILTANQSGSQPITLGSSSDTSNFLSIAKLNADDGGTLTYGQNEGKVDLTKPLNSSGLSKSVKSGIFTINGVSIYVNATSDTLQDVIDKINSSGAGVTASYNAASDTLDIISKSDGPDVITIGSAQDTSNFWWATNMVYPPNEDLGSDDVLSTEVIIGSPAVGARLEVDGVTYVRKSNTINDIINGVTLNLHSASPVNVGLSLSSDTDTIIDKIAAFIVAYNTTMEMSNQKALTSEQRNKQLPELTDTQKANMSDDEIEEYNANREALLRQDILHRDTTVRSIHNSLRLLSSQIVSGLDSRFNSLAAIGINTGAWGAIAGSNPNGMLVIESTDEEKIKEALRNNSTFMKAIQENPDKVYQLMAQLGTSTASVMGTQDISNVTLDQDLKFTIGDGTSTAEVNLTAGTYTGDEILASINSALSKAGIKTISVALNSGNQLQFQSTIKDAASGQALIKINDLSNGLLYSALGLSPGEYAGEKLENQTGLAHRWESLVKQYTQVNGLLNLKIKTGGTLDKELQTIEKSIAAFEERLSTIEQRLWEQFSALEEYISEANQQSAWLTQQLQLLNGLNSSSYNSGY